MSWLCLLLLVGMILVLFFLKDYRRSYVKTSFEAAGLRRLLYAAGVWLFDHMGQRRKTNAIHKAERLYPLKNPAIQARKLFVRRFSLVYLLLIAVQILALTLALSEKGNNIFLESLTLERGSYDEESVYQLEVWHEQWQESFPVDIHLNPQAYTEEEVREYFKEIRARLPDMIKGENESLNQVRKALVFPDRVHGYPIHIEWQTTDYNLISSTGKIRTIPLEPILTEVTATLSYKDYQEFMVIPIRLVEPEKTEAEQFLDVLEASIDALDNELSLEAQVRLPDAIGQTHIRWREVVEDNAAKVWGLGVVICIVIFIYSGRQTDEKLKERQQMLASAYPECVHKAILLMNAGLPVRRAWTRITDEYGQNPELQKREQYLYEEMLYTLREMEYGIPEITAYENFGRRCMLPQYLKFSTLLIQCIKRGSKGIHQLLTETVQEAETIRREEAKRMAERAGTRLLMPMILLLASVLVIVVCPAFLSMNI